MKVLFNKQIFLDATSLVGRIASHRNPGHALSGVLVSVENNSVTLHATDGEISVVLPVVGNVEEEGKVLLPARLLMEIVRSLTGDEVSINFKGGESHAELSSGKAQFKVRVLPVGDFPEIPETQGVSLDTIPVSTFTDAYELVTRSVSRDDTRPVLTGVLVSLQTGTMTMAATDSYRLSVCDLPLDISLTEPLEINIPARTLNEVSRLAGTVVSDQLCMTSSSTSVTFSIGKARIVSRLLDGQFPNFRKLIPETFDHEILVAREEFSGVVQRIGLLAQKNIPIRLSLKTGELCVQAQTPEIGEAEEVIAVDYQGEGIEVGFNPEFLRDGIASVKTEQLRIRLIDPLRPGLIQPEPSSGFLYLIMPVRLRNTTSQDS